VDGEPVRAPSVALRAALVALLLVLFYVLALAAVAALVALSVLAFRAGIGTVAGKLGFVTVLVALALARAVVAVERRSRDDLPGRPVSRAEEPQLWALVDDVARRLSTRPPEELRLVDDVNAFVTQDARLLGLVDGRRTMAVGIALLHCVNVSQLRAVLAHEFGHYTGGDTRLGPLTYRATATVSRAVDNLGPRSPLGRLFGLYADLVHRTSLAVRRRQEVSADLTAAALFGADVHARALRDVHAGAAAYDFFLEQYVAPLVERGVRPRDLYAGFSALLDDPARKAELARLLEDVDAEPPGRYDSHPSLGQRLAVLAGAPAGAPDPEDGRPAVVLLADPEAGRRTTDELLAHLPGLRVVDDFADAAPVYAAGPEEAGASVLQAVADVDGGPRPGTIGRALDLVEAGRGPELVVAVTRDRRTAEDPVADVADTLAVPLAAEAARQLVAAGRARHRVDWGGPLRLVTSGGSVLDLAEEVHAALLQPQSLAALRASLTAQGVRLDAAPPPTAGLAARRDAVQLVLPAMRVLGARGVRVDLLMTDEALLAVQYAGPAGRVRAVVRAYREPDDHDEVLAAAAARLEPVADADPEELASRPEVTRFVWDDLHSVVLGRSRKGRAYALAVRTAEDGDPVTYTTGDGPVHQDEVLERLVVALGGDRVLVTE
jgi:Zn-dependent protease with chaperone function